jgi:hypothetical protein
MSHPGKDLEAEKLLGGFATGTLSAQEKTELFAAALKHQELFDALADEEALRELLADPKARQQLLEVLEEEPKVVPFWRRPVVLGLAAGLMLLVTTTMLVRRQPELASPVTRKPSDSAPKPAGTPAAPPPRTEAKRSAQRAGLDKAVGEATRAKSGAAKEEEQVLHDRKVFDEAGPAVAPHPQASMAGNATGSLLREAPAAAPAVQSAGAAEAKADYAVSEKHKLVKKAVAEQRNDLAAPVCSLVRLEEGRARLTVMWDSSGYLYVLKRRGALVSVLSPLRATPSGSGRLESVFEFTLDGVLDVYLLRSAAAQPDQLPAEGSVDGHRRRLGN